MRTLKVFLASSSQLKEDRDEFEIFLYRENKGYIKDNIFLDLIRWEDFNDSMSKTRLQDEYNKEVQDADIFVSLYGSKVGKFTEEEFDVAYESFKRSGKPLVYTYFKNISIGTNEITEEVITLIKFKEKLSQLGHYFSTYKDNGELKYLFKGQLSKVLPLILSKKAALSGYSYEEENNSHLKTITNKSSSAIAFEEKQDIDHEIEIRFKNIDINKCNEKEKERVARSITELLGVADTIKIFNGIKDTIKVRFPEASLMEKFFKKMKNLAEKKYNLEVDDAWLVDGIESITLEPRTLDDGFLFEIEESAKTPKVSLNAKTGKCIINGRSVPENSHSFYTPIIAWFKKYLGQTHQK